MAREVPTAAERIRELSDINNDVAAMLGSAGQALNALTNRPPVPSSRQEDTQMAESSDDTVDAHKKAFTEHTEAYFTGLQAVFARLRRQAYALEEAGIITADAASMAATPRRAAGAQQGGAGGAEGERMKNGGLGNFDVGWLNSRGNKVGDEKEAELIQEARQLLEDVLERSTEAT